MALFVAALVVLFLLRIADVLLLVFVAALLAVYLSWLTDHLERRLRLSRGLGLTAAVGVTLAVVAGAGALILPPVVLQTQELVSGLPRYLAQAQAALASVVRNTPVLRQTELADPQSGLVAQVIADAADYLRGAALPYVKAGGKVFIEGFSVLVMGLYLARRPQQYSAGLVAVVSPRWRPLAAAVLGDAAQTLRAWVVAQLINMTVLGLLTAIGLWALGVPYWLAFGVFTGVVSIVPYFGTLVSTLLPALFVLGSGGVVKALAVVALGAGVHAVEANLVIPLVMQHRVALPPVLTILSVLVVAKLLGAVGLIVAVPVLAVTMVVVRHAVLGELYGDRGAAGERPAVLVPTGEFARRRPGPARP